MFYCILHPEGLGTDYYAQNTPFLPRSDLTSAQTSKASFILKNKVRPMLSPVHSDHPRLLPPGETRHFSNPHVILYLYTSDFQLHITSPDALQKSGLYFQLPTLDLQDNTGKTELLIFPQTCSF